MSDEAQAKPAQKSSKGPMITLILVLGVALLEGGAFFVAIKFFGAGAKAAYGQDGAGMLEEANQAEIKTSEIPLLTGCRVTNTKSGRAYLYDFDVTVVVPSDDEAKLDQIKKAIESRDGEIRDRIAGVVRKAPPQVLNQDDYSQLKEQLKQELTDILRDPDAIRKVLIPRCVPMPVN